MPSPAAKVSICALIGMFAFALAESARSQIVMGLGTYVETFDSLASEGIHGWTNNHTLPGWYASRTAGSTEVTNYASGNGSSIVGAFYSFGSLGSPERALGTLASGTPGNFAFGVRCTNDTGVARSNIVVTYTGEQWRVGGTPPQHLAFSYRIGNSLTNAEARNTANWTPFPALDFTSPNTNATQTLNGNAATNRATMTGALTGVIIGPGQELFLRWRDEDDAGFDDALAVDDLTVSFGEPVTNVPPVVSTNDTFSVVAYNLKGNFASDWSTNAPQVQAIARQLRFLNPDIIALNEIPNGLRHEMTNWMSAFFPAYQLCISPGTDGALRNGVISRYSVIRSNSWLDGAGLTNFGFAGTFTRDLFEAQIAVPGFPHPLHLFVAHLKSGTDSLLDIPRRAAEASAISNFFVNGFLTSNALHTYLLAGDMNEDIAFPVLGIHRLTNGTGLVLTTPLNPVSLSPFTHSIQSSNGPTHRYDYIFPSASLAANIQSAQVFRTDLLNPLPETLNNDDSQMASDHLPVQMIFRNPFLPFRITSIQRANSTVTLTWEAMPGHFYTLESASELANSNAWSIVVPHIPATADTVTLTATVPDSLRFFRVVRE